MSVSKLLAFGILLLSVSCKKENSNVTENTSKSITTFYLIRHAEKENADPNDVDPELSQDGLGRAMHWAEILNKVEMDAIYSTDYNRTSMTAAPLSVKRNIDIQYFNPDTLNIKKFIAENENKKVFVVGHSKSTPDMVNALIGEDKYPPIDDSENGLLYIVTIVNGVAADTQLLFNCNCPD